MESTTENIPPRTQLTYVYGQGIRRLKEQLVESISDASCVRGKGEKAR